MKQFQTGATGTTCTGALQTQATALLDFFVEVINLTPQMLSIVLNLEYYFKRPAAMWSRLWLSKVWLHETASDLHPKTL